TQVGCDKPPSLRNVFELRPPHAGVHRKGVQQYHWPPAARLDDSRGLAVQLDRPLPHTAMIAWRPAAGGHGGWAICPTASAASCSPCIIPPDGRRAKEITMTISEASMRPRIAVPLVATVCVAFCAMSASGQTVDEIVSRHIEGRGGYDRLKAIQSIK